MPRVKRKPRGRTGYTPRHIEELLSGHTFIIGTGFGYDRFREHADRCLARGGTTEEAAYARAQFEAVRADMRELWNDSRTWLVGEWIHSDEPAGFIINSERSGPGTRPWCWWELDAPEPRRQLSDGPPNSTMQEDQLGGGKLNYGIPCWFATVADGEIQYESQGEYLDRLGLWHDDAERAHWLEHKDDPPPADDDDREPTP